MIFVSLAKYQSVGNFDDFCCPAKLLCVGAKTESDHFSRLSCTIVLENNVNISPGKLVCFKELQEKKRTYDLNSY